MKIVGLVDVNSFYCSCERVFRPETRGRPVIVLSNNDGCAIAFTREAKAIGFGEMCEPYFKIKERIENYNVAVFSSNYTLYDNMSRRVMSLLSQFTPQLEIYSVDEAFLDFSGQHNLLPIAQKIRFEVLKQTGLPVGVGISKTKVLAKIANKLAKKSSGAVVLLDENEIDHYLKHFPVQDIWGIGRASANKLGMLGIKTAWDFKIYENEKLIQKLLTKTGRQIQDELRGVNCLSLEDVEDKKNIGTSRSFGQSVYTKKELQEALAEFTTVACEKLRRQDCVCFGVTTFIHTNYFKEGSPQYYGVGTKNFLSGSSDTLKVIKEVHKTLDEIYRPGYEYKKAGVLLTHILPRNQNQIEMFCERPDDNEKLSQIVDLINNRYGAYTIKSAACGVERRWKTLANHKSQRYTNAWNEILKVQLTDT